MIDRTETASRQSQDHKPQGGGVLRLIVIAAVLIAVGGGVYWYLQRGADQTAATAAAPPGPPVEISVPYQQETTDWNEYTGQFVALDSVDLRARVNGYLTDIRFQDGQMVTKGDVLFIIDQRPFEIALSSARAGLDQARARLELANRQVARAGELRQRDFIAQSTYDERSAEVKSAEAAVTTARESIRSAELDLEFSKITAPISGRIGRHQVSTGNLIQSGSSASPTLLATIVSLDPIQFDFDMSEADLLAYQRAVAEGRLPSPRDSGIEVKAKLGDEKIWRRTGKLDFLDNRIDRGAGTIRARATFANADLFLVPGQFARLRVPASQPYQALMVPDRAVVTDQATKLLLTVSDDGTVVPKPVVVGPLVDGLRVIRSGITATDKVIINGLVRARPGSKVTPKDGKIEPVPQAG